MKKKISRKWRLTIILSIVLGLPILLFLYEWFFYAGGMKRIYYRHFTAPENWQVVKDDGFLVNKPGYSQDYKLSGDYYVPHRIILVPDCFDVPPNYELKAAFRIEIYDKSGSLLYSEETDNFTNIYRAKKDDYYGNYMVYIGTQPKKAVSAFGFEIGEIPFSLVKFRGLKDMHIKITVLEPDTELKEHCDNAALLIIPDLRM